MRRLLVVFSSLLLPFSAAQADVTFDFSVNSFGPNPLATSITDNGVTADGFKDNPTLASAANLWRRNQDDDHGIGVCSEGTVGITGCIDGTGDVNEVSNQANPEAIRLARPVNTNWSSLFVSSLDNGGSNSAEKGILWWSNSATSFTNFFLFGYGDFGSNVFEGNVLGLAAATAAGFDPTAKYVLFTNNTANGTNNDYLVWKGVLKSPVPDEPIPEPGSMALFGAGLALLAMARRRKLN